ncbi:hypothetical protein [Pseudoxanthomonas sp. 10H]|uniref:hypothetical protein n=1 Tax=Pseudoxanthomonas sp. 10H TaxID=3242729 RepID=UPI003557DA8D
MDPIEAMKSASLVAMAALVVVPLISRAFALKHFSYPALIGFCAGYVAGAALAALVGAAGVIEDLLQLGAAVAVMQSVRYLGRQRARAA